ncbi:unnamed protein product [Ilex paraguariensis]|uniref:Uncharacterized protein n=1 Tax=Ilex paraguariensis TaxID=185542 RepID=A0ABC8U3L4_9AQUA
MNDIIEHFNSSAKAKVEDIICGNQWQCPVTQFSGYKEILTSMLDYNPNPRTPDQVKWSASANGHYTTKSDWSSISTPSSKVCRSKLVWFGKAIPKNEFYFVACCSGEIEHKG